MPDIELRNMEGILEELEEAKADIERLRAECKMKGELSENLKRDNRKQFEKLQEANSKIAKQTEELSEKEEELSMEKKRLEELQQILVQKESALKHLGHANDKLRADSNEKFGKLVEEKINLLSTLDDTNEKCTNQERAICEYRKEIEGLKENVLIWQRKCSEVEERSLRNKLGERDDILIELNDETAKLKDQLKWKTEQFKHLEDALEKVRDQVKVSKKEYELEKNTLLDEISTLQTKLDSQMLISKDLTSKLEMCNQALAHEESRRKCLQIRVTDLETRFGNVLDECECAKLQLDEMTAQRDKEIATLRSLLGSKDSFLKEREYQTRKLEEENQELRTALKELQEEQIQSASGSHSFRELQKKMQSLEISHGECIANLRAKEVEWMSRVEEVASNLNDSKSELCRREASVKDLEATVESQHSSALQLKLQNEEFSIMLLVLNQAISETHAKLSKEMAAVCTRDKDNEDKISFRELQKKMQSLEIAHGECSAKLKAKEVEWMSRFEEVSSNLNDSKSELCRREAAVKDLEATVESQHSSALQLKLQNEKFSIMLLVLNQAISETRAKLTKEMAAVYTRNKDNEEKISSLMKQMEVQNTALAKADKDIEEERDKVASLTIRVESLEEQCSEMKHEVCKVNAEKESIDARVQEQYKSKMKELDQSMKILEESSSRNYLLLEEQLSQIERDAMDRLQEACNALEEANSELDDKICEGNQIDFEMHTWRSIAKQLKVDIEENHRIKRELQASLLAEVHVGVNFKQEKHSLMKKLNEKDKKIESLEQQVMLLEQGLEIIELEATALSGTDSSASSFESMRDGFLRDIKEKDEMLEQLKNEVEFLEQDSLRRELEVAVLSHTSAERIFELEDDICVVQQKLDLQERKESEMKLKLKYSDVLIDELESEKSSLIDLMSVIGNKINEFSNSDRELMVLLDKIMPHCANECQGIELKENVNSPSNKTFEVSADGRSPFRELNQ